MCRDGDAVRAEPYEPPFCLLPPGNGEGQPFDKLRANGIESLLAAPLILVARLWQFGPSRLLPPACRFEPSCSAYAIEALSRYGALAGMWLTLKRLLRCHPWGGCGVDPVP